MPQQIIVTNQGRTTVVPTGPVGPPGPQGPQGIQGIQGEPGSSANVRHGFQLVMPLPELIGEVEHHRAVVGGDDKLVYFIVATGAARLIISVDPTVDAAADANTYQPFEVVISNLEAGAVVYSISPIDGSLLDITAEAWWYLAPNGVARMSMYVLPGAFFGQDHDVWMGGFVSSAEPRHGHVSLMGSNLPGDGITEPDGLVRLDGSVSGAASVTADVSGYNFVEVSGDFETFGFQPLRLDLSGVHNMDQIRVSDDFTISTDIPIPPAAKASGRFVAYLNYTRLPSPAFTLDWVGAELLGGKTAVLEDWVKFKDPITPHEADDSGTDDPAYFAIGYEVAVFEAAAGQPGCVANLNFQNPGVGVKTRTILKLYNPSPGATWQFNHTPGTGEVKGSFPTVGNTWSTYEVWVTGQGTATVGDPLSVVMVPLVMHVPV